MICTQSLEYGGKFQFILPRILKARCRTKQEPTQQNWGCLPLAPRVPTAICQGLTNPSTQVGFKEPERHKWLHQSLVTGFTPSSGFMGSRTLLHSRAKLRVSLTRRTNILAQNLYPWPCSALQSHCPVCGILPSTQGHFSTHWKIQSMRWGLPFRLVFTAKSLLLQTLPGTEWRLNWFQPNEGIIAALDITLGHTHAPSFWNKHNRTYWGPLISLALPSLWILAASYVTDGNSILLPFSKFEFKTYSTPTKVYNLTFSLFSDHNSFFFSFVPVRKTWTD